MEIINLRWNKTFSRASTQNNPDCKAEPVHYHASPSSCACPSITVECHQSLSRSVEGPGVSLAYFLPPPCSAYPLISYRIHSMSLLDQWGYLHPQEHPYLTVERIPWSATASMQCPCWTNEDTYTRKIKIFKIINNLTLIHIILYGIVHWWSHCNTNKHNK